MTRLQLHEKLCDALGSRHVYFEPPESVKMVYPAIVYSRTKIDLKYADGRVWRQVPGYTVIVIDEDPDSEIPNRITELSMCRFAQHYTADNLNHDVFLVYA